MLVSVILFSEANNFYKKVRSGWSLNNSNPDNYEIFLHKLNSKNADISGLLMEISHYTNCSIDFFRIWVVLGQEVVIGYYQCQI